MPRCVSSVEIIESLRGTCRALYEILEYHDLRHLEDDKYFLDDLDNALFRCETCSWWCEWSEQSENTEDYICEDCFE